MSKSLYETVTNYVENHKRSLKTAGLVGLITLSVGLTGCGLIKDINRKTIVGTAIKIKAGDTKDPKKAYRAGVIGESLIGEGQNEPDKSDQNKPNDNQERQQPSQEQQQPKYDSPSRVAEGTDENYLFAFTGYGDKDGDGTYRLKEFDNVKKSEFYRGEPLGFCIYNTSKRGDVRFVFEDEKGKILKDITEKDYYKGGIIIRGPPDGIPDTGRYKARWYIDGVLIGIIEVELFRDKENPNKKSK